MLSSYLQRPAGWLLGRWPGLPAQLGHCVLCCSLQLSQKACCACCPPCRFTLHPSVHPCKDLLLQRSVPFMSLPGCQILASLQEVSGAAPQACQSSQGRSVWQRSGCQGLQSSTWQWATGATGKMLHTSGAAVLPLTTDDDASLPESFWRPFKICWPTASHSFAEGKQQR